MNTQNEKQILNFQVTKRLAEFLEQEKLKHRVPVSHLIRESLRKTYPELEELS